PGIPAEGSRDAGGRQARRARRFVRDRRDPDAAVAEQRPAPALRSVSQIGRAAKLSAPSTPNSQRPTPNQLQTPSYQNRDLDHGGNWELGFGWELGIGSWELTRIRKS